MVDGWSWEGKAKNISNAAPAPPPRNAGSQRRQPPPNIAYYGEKQILLYLSHSECSFLLPTAGHIPNSHKHVAWIWLCPPENPPSTIERTKAQEK